MTVFRCGKDHSRAIASDDFIIDNGFVQSRVVQVRAPAVRAIKCERAFSDTYVGRVSPVVREDCPHAMHSQIARAEHALEVRGHCELSARFASEARALTRSITSELKGDFGKCGFASRGNATCVLVFGRAVAAIEHDGVSYDKAFYVQASFGD